MSNLRRAEKLICAGSILADIALNGDRMSSNHIAWKLLPIVFHITRDAGCLAQLVVDTFDRTGAFPDIYKHIELVLGKDIAVTYKDAVIFLDNIRVEGGGSALPIRYKDECSETNNVIFMKDFLYLRKSAA